MRISEKSPFYRDKMGKYSRREVSELHTPIIHKWSCKSKQRLGRV